MKYFQEVIDKLKSELLFRQIPSPFFHKEDGIIYKDEKEFVNLTSNDYLGFSFDKVLIDEFLSKLKDKELMWLSSSGSRLLSGNSFVHEELESLLAEKYNKPVLLLNSGFHANIGIIPAIANRDDIIFFDRLCHASIIDGILLSGAKFYRYEHLDYEHLEKLLIKYRKLYKNAFLITESIFSMDGDTVLLEKIIELKNRFNLITYVDEAHSVGVLGKKGLGLAENNGLINEIDILIGTFGKAFSSVGAYVVTSQIIKDYIVNRCRSFIYSTSLPPINIAWTKFILEKIVSDEGKVRREKLREKIKFLRENFKKLQLKTMGDSQIIPVITFSNERALSLSKILYEKGFYVLPIRHPTVPKNTARIRISLNAQISNEKLSKLVETLKELRDGILDK